MTAHLALPGPVLGISVNKLAVCCGDKIHCQASVEAPGAAIWPCLVGMCSEQHEKSLRMALQLECVPCRAGDVKKSRKQLAREAEAGPAAEGPVVPVPAPASHALEAHSQPAAAANSGESPMAQHAGGCNLTWKPIML